MNNFKVNNKIITNILDKNLSAPAKINLSSASQINLLKAHSLV